MFWFTTRHQRFEKKKRNSDSVYTIKDIQICKVRNDTVAIIIISQAENMCQAFHLSPVKEKRKILVNFVFLVKNIKILEYYKIFLYLKNALVSFDG